MMSTVFKCDECKTEIGLKPHISLVVAGSEKTGIAMPPDATVANESEFVLASLANKRPYWQVITKGIKGKFMHFCNGQCIGRYFGRRIKEAKEPKPDF